MIQAFLYGSPTVTQVGLFLNVKEYFSLLDHSGCDPSAEINFHIVTLLTNVYMNVGGKGFSIHSPESKEKIASIMLHYLTYLQLLVLLQQFVLPFFWL